MNAHRPDGAGPRHCGVHPAIVTDILDPDELGRVEVRLPWLGNHDGADVRAWATLCTPYAGDDQGFEFVPEVDSQVLVAFEGGDPRRPYVLGACWNGKERLPETPAKANDKRLIRTRSGSELVFDDAASGASVTLTTKTGHSVALDAATNEIRVEHPGGSAITITALGQIEIEATGTVEVTAAALNVHAGTATFDGIINCKSLFTEASISSPLYTPGAGNVW